MYFSKHWCSSCGVEAPISAALCISPAARVPVQVQQRRQYIAITSPLIIKCCNPTCFKPYSLPTTCAVAVLSTGSVSTEAVLSTGSTEAVLSTGSVSTGIVSTEAALLLDGCCSSTLVEHTAVRCGFAVVLTDHCAIVSGTLRSASEPAPSTHQHSICMSRYSLRTHLRRGSGRLD